MKMVMGYNQRTTASADLSFTTAPVVYSHNLIVVTCAHRSFRNPPSCGKQEGTERAICVKGV
jgi:hypothetical protein